MVGRARVVERGTLIKQEEKARQKAEKEARLEQEETGKSLLDLPPVDMGNGEILDRGSCSKIFHLFQKKSVGGTRNHPAQAELKFLNRKMTQMTKMFRSIFQPKKPLNTNFQAYNSLQFR